MLFRSMPGLQILETERAHTGGARSARLSRDVLPHKPQAAVEGKAGVTRVAIGAKVGEITILIATLQRDGKSEMSTTMNKLW